MKVHAYFGGAFGLDLGASLHLESRRRLVAADERVAGRGRHRLAAVEFEHLLITCKHDAMNETSMTR